MNKFNDFVLYEVNHITDFERMLVFFGKSWKELSKTINQRVKFAKKIILTESKPGDTVLIESPISDQKILQFSTEQRKKTMLMGPELKYFLFSQNVYSRIARFARRHGRVVVSADSGTRENFQSSFYKLKRNAEATQKEIQEVQLLPWKYSQIMVAKIQSTRPALVFVAEGHVPWIEQELQPRKVITSTPTEKREKIARCTQEKFLKLKMLQQTRRARINEKFGLNKSRARKT